MNKPELKAEAILYYAEHPYDFVVDILEATPTFQQKQVLDIIIPALKENKGIAVKSGHGVGKTALESWIIIWFMVTRPNAKMPCTAPTRENLFDVLWSELAKWHNKSNFDKAFEWTKTHYYNRKYSETWFATARTSNKPENMQGFHGEHLVFIVDEASGVDAPILEAIEGSQTQKGSLIIYLGNPTQISGGFYDAFNTKRRFYYTFTFSSEDSPLVKKEYYEKIAAKYGKDSDIYRVRVLGLFPKAEPDTLIPLDRCEKAGMRELDRPDIARYDDVEIGVDVARFGDDETMIYSRIADVIEEEASLRKRDLMTVAGEVVKVARKFEGKNITVNVDDSGLGGGVTDRLRELVKQGIFNATIVGVNNGSKANESDKYINKGAEMWFFMREKIQELKIPNDNDLIAQLSTRKYSINSAGKHVVESKEHMKSRGLVSPDRADAAILALHSLIYSTDREGLFAVA